MPQVEESEDISLSACKLASLKILKPSTPILHHSISFSYHRCYIAHHHKPATRNLQPVTGYSLLQYFNIRGLWQGADRPFPAYEGENGVDILKG